MAILSFPFAAWPVRLEYFSGWTALLIFAALGLPVIFMGLWSLAGLGPTRKWVAICTRLAVLLCFVLVIGGVRWQRQHKDLEVIVARDISTSIDQFRDFQGDSLDAAIEKYLTNASKNGEAKPPGDRIGVISFSDNAWIDVIPGMDLRFDTKPIHDKRGSGTDIASALQLAMATFRNDAMRRIVLVTDANANLGDLESALATAVSQHVPIDVFPLHYRIQNELMMDRFVTPAWKRQNEPFTIEAYVRSTNRGPVTGKLTVLMDGRPIEITAGQGSRTVTLQPGLNRFPVQVPGLEEAGVHRFEAVFEGNNQGGKVDTLLSNNKAEAFTFVRGKGQVLYVDNVVDKNGAPGPGQLLENALVPLGITLKTISVDKFPTKLIELESFDAVILANVPKGTGGLGSEQEAMLASYVHDMGGGLVMIGGPDAFGAGGWQGSKLAEVLPVNMEVPAQRMIPKGALVLVMHSCEMPQGNYWGEQCALEALKTLAGKDEIGVLSYAWNNPGKGGGVNGAAWDFPLKEKGDGTAVTAAIKQMALGDMPSFEDAITLAVNGSGPGQPCLINSNAKQRHIIVISDGDPPGCSQKLIDQCKAQHISISTVTVFPHGGAQMSTVPGVNVPEVMYRMAKETKGRWYGPINQNPNQLPQIFIKEATVVQRSLIHEEEKGIPVVIADNTSDLIKGFGEGFPNLYGMVLTSRKTGAQNDIKIPLVAQNGKNQDPVLAQWQAGLGRVVVFAGDAHNRWGSAWASSRVYGKFWAQVVRSVARPPMSSDFDVRTVQVGNKGKIIVEANSKDAGFLNFLNIGGTVVGPDMQPHSVRLVQTGPGTYEGEFDASTQGNYVAMMRYQNKEGTGDLLSGMTVNSSPEQRDLVSNDTLLEQIASRTGGRVLKPFDAAGAQLFTREGLTPSSSPLPVWDILLPILLGLIVFDVGIRRIAWDWASIRRAILTARAGIRERLSTRKIESAPTLSALKRVRDDVAEQRFKQTETKTGDAGTAGRPDPGAKFAASGAVEGDITQVVGGASNKPIPSAPKKIEPKGGTTGGLMEAKRRAQQQIKKKEQGE